MTCIDTRIAPVIFKDTAEDQFRQARINHWNRVSQQKKNSERPGVFYHKLLQYYYGFFIPPGLRILELGCGHADLLSSLTPFLGVGLDFSEEMVRTAKERHPNHLF